MMKFNAARLLAAAVICGPCLCSAPATAQILKKEPATDQLACGQKVLVENNTCPPDQILEVTGSCLKNPPAPASETVRMPRGTQYNCVSRKRD